MSTSTAAEAAVLDALYGDLPPYRPELAEGTEVEGVVVPEVSSLPLYQRVGCRQFRQVRS